MTLHTDRPSVNPLAVPVQIRLLGEEAIVPSSTGKGCYRVQYENGLSTHCPCEARRRAPARSCKHMLAVDVALKVSAQCYGKDTITTYLTPQTRTAPKPAPKAAPWASLYATAPAPTRTPADLSGLAAHMAKFDATADTATNDARAASNILTGLAA